MIAKKLTRKFFARSTLIVAQELLGKYLVRKIGNKKIEVMITETEAYVGPDDLASHASRGRTPRTEIMFGEAGHAYVYMIYGMYYCLNFVTEKKDYPAAVLIRGAILDQNVKIKMESDKSKFKNSLDPNPYTLKPNLDGPGKLCRYFQIDTKLNGEDVTKSGKLWVEDPAPKKILVRGKPGWTWSKVSRASIKAAKRIGIDYAGTYKHKPWRFYTKGDI